MSDTPSAAGPQDLSQLEMAFAADPKAFVPLTTEYLRLGRFMEAMVVCKKGIKALPDSVDGKLLLARVYAEQGKVPKAIEELKGILGTNNEPLVSMDFNGNPNSSTFDLKATTVIDGVFCRVMSWYDNEWGFSNRMGDVAVLMGKLG